ncbi:MAG: hypothetical protein QNJ55_10570 [Xenococcus sp. MO_188.B8]|nr:hypothetical protein [Xenococcus sp. MO_188.B8]
MFKQLISIILKFRFLQRIDRYLLLKYPRLWAMRIHDAYYYGLLADFLIIFLIMIFPFKPHHIQYIWTAGIMVLAIDITLLIYISTKQRYDIEKQYGNTSKNKGYLEIIGYMACIIILISPTLIFPWTIRAKASLSGITQQELIADIVTLQAVRENLAFSYICSLDFTPQDDCLKKGWKQLEKRDFKRIRDDPWKALEKSLDFLTKMQAEGDSEEKSVDLETCLDPLSIKFIEIVDDNLLSEFDKSLNISSSVSTKIIKDINNLVMWLKEGNPESYKIIFKKIIKYEGINIDDKDKASQHLLSLVIPLSEYKNLPDDSDKKEKTIGQIFTIKGKGYVAGTPYYLNLVKNYNLIYLPFKLLVLFLNFHILVLFYLPLCLFLGQSVKKNFSCIIIYLWGICIWFIYFFKPRPNYRFYNEWFIDYLTASLLETSLWTLCILIIILSWILLDKWLNKESRYSLCMEFLLSMLPLILVVLIYSSILHLYLHLYLTGFREFLPLPLDDKVDQQILFSSFLIIALLSYFPLITYLKGEFIKLLSLPEEQ